MIDFALVAVGVLLILIALAGLINTLVSTSTSPARWWPTQMIGTVMFGGLRGIANRLPEDSSPRERVLSAYGPVLVIMLLASWAIMQITGFALIWWTRTDIATVTGFGDAWYYSGIVYFTVGFGEIVPAAAVPRAGAILEAFFGVITVALVIGYLPALYAAYSERERMLMTLDAGDGNRITPTALVKAWSPDADPKKIDAQFEKWEMWAAGILETHSTVPILTLFRSHDRRQNWVTALGLLCDAAVHAQIIMGATDGNAYWFLRRAEAIFEEITQGHDLSAYQSVMDETRSADFFEALYTDLTSHGFDLRPFDEAAAYTRQTRATFAPELEYLIDHLLCPRGFWPLTSTVLSWSSQYEIARYDA